MNASPSEKKPQALDIAKLKAYLVSQIMQQIGSSYLKEEDRQQAVRQHLTQAYQSLKINLAPTLRDQLFHDILDDLLGYGPIQSLLEDDSINEVMVNGPKSVYVERGNKVVKTNITFENDDEVIRLIDRIILPIGRRIDSDSPTVDARLPDGSRVNAVIPPVAIDGPAITIRKFRKDHLTIENLIEYGSMTRPMAEFIRACVVSRFNIIISGGTGSGKTTLLNVLSSFIPPEERIITIEDAAELRLQQEHVLRLETKPPNIEGKHAVTIRDLVRNSLRMRPERIVVGEVRGGESLDMLQAMNTGHDGSMTTLHANSPRDAISRLETMVLMAGMDLPIKVVREQIASAIDVIVQQARLRDGSRKVTSITEVVGMEGDMVVMTEIYRFEQTGVAEDGKVLGELKPTGIRPLFSARLEAAGFRLGPEMFGANIAEMLAPQRRR